MTLVGILVALSFGSPIDPSGRCTIVDHGKQKVTIFVPPSNDMANNANLRAARILEESVYRMTSCRLIIQSSPTPGGQNSINIGFGQIAGTGSRSKAFHSKIRSKLRPDGFAILTEGTNMTILSGGKKGAVYGVVGLLEKYFGCRCYSPTAFVFPKRESMAVENVLDIENPAVAFRAVNGDFSNDPTYLDWTRGNRTDELFGQGYYVHTFNKLVPKETLFANHPEYFSFMNGRRGGDQLCPSNPDIIPIIIEKLKAEMAKQPDKHFWSVSQNDNESYCHCPTCLQTIKEEGAPSGPLLRLVNQIAKHFPNQTISTLAYEWSRKAPRRTGPAKNVQIMLCTIEADRSMPIATNPTTQDFVRDIHDWQALSDNIYLWDYTVDFNHQISPFPNLDVLAPNIRFFNTCGVNQIFEQTNTSPGHEFSELKAYLLSKLLWNPNLDPQRIIHEFCQGYYGPAGVHIEEYIRQLNAAMVASKTRLDIFESPIKHADDFLSERHLSEYGSLLYPATAASDGEYRKRVNTVSLQLQYARLVIGADDIYGQRGFYNMEIGKPVMRISIPGTFDLFAEIAQQNNVRSINEKNMTPRQFRDSLVQMTTLDVAGNLAFGAKVSSTPSPSKKYAHGDLNVLTNGVHGGNDFNAQWVGWDGVDFEFTLDLGVAKTMSSVEVNSLSNGESWILHPDKIECFVSADGKGFFPWGSEALDVMHKDEARIHHFSIKNPYGPYEHKAFRYVMFRATGAKKLPAWHSWGGSSAWTFLDEVVIR